MDFDVVTLQNNFEYIMKHEPKVAAKFYEHFFAVDPKIEGLFANANAQSQQQMFMKALSAILYNMDNQAWVASTMKDVGDRHRGYGVDFEAHYPAFVTAIVDTFAEASGDTWNEDLRKGWIRAFEMIGGYLT